MRDNRLRFLAKHGDWLSRQPRPGRVTDNDRWRSSADCRAVDASTIRIWRAAAARYARPSPCKTGR